MKHFWKISFITRDYIFNDGNSESWSSMFWRTRETNTISKIMVFLLGENHCEKSYNFHKEEFENI